MMGVLQVLSYVHRRGAEIGGPAAELGRLSGEQEEILRGLVNRDARAGSVGAPDSTGASRDTSADLVGLVDLTAALSSLRGRTVTVSTPGHPVEVSAHAAGELIGAVRAALDNVTRHAGDTAHAWVLLEDEGAQLVVTVRDDGVGVTAERLTAAATEQRMGVAQSIVGRLADLGGTASGGPGDRWRYRGRTGAATMTPLDAINPSERALIRVMVVDDHPIWREAVAADLGGAGYDIVATVGDGATAVRIAPAVRPDVVLMDVQLPQLGGAEATAQIVAADPSVRVLMFSASGEDADVLAAVTSGARGYLTKSASREDLLDAVARTAAGEAVFSPGLAALVLGAYRQLSVGKGRTPAGEPELTEREREVLRLAAKGLTARQIAEHLVLSHRTVQNHIQNTLRKLQLRNKVELTRWAIEQGIAE